MPTRTLAEQVHEGFPGAVPADAFVAGWAQRCGENGFRPGTCLLLVGVCRDEVCFPFVRELEAIWGPAFHIGSLGGLLTIGRTGIAAAANHAPDEPGQPRRYVVVSAAHIGMDQTGTFGYLRRAHQVASTRTCGALMAFRDELITSRLHLGYDPVDPEMSLLRQRIFSALDYGDIPEPVDLTRIVAAVIDEDLRELLTWVAQDVNLDHEVQMAVVTGVLIHTRAGDWVDARTPRVWSSRAPERHLDLDPRAQR